MQHSLLKHYILDFIPQDNRNLVLFPHICANLCKLGFVIHILSYEPTYDRQLVSILSEVTQPEDIYVTTGTTLPPSNI